MNRVERWLIKQAFPEIDLATVREERIYAQVMVIPYWFGRGDSHLGQDTVETTALRWARFYEDDEGSDYVHYAQVKIGYSKEANTLVIREVH